MTHVFTWTQKLPNKQGKKGPSKKFSNSILCMAWHAINKTKVLETRWQQRNRAGSLQIYRATLRFFRKVSAGSADIFEESSSRRASNSFQKKKKDCWTKKTESRVYRLWTFERACGWFREKWVSRNWRTLRCPRRERKMQPETTQKEVRAVRCPLDEMANRYFTLV